MTEPATDDADDFDAPLTLQDWIEVVADDLDQAADALSEQEVEQLCRAIRRKLAEINGDGDRPVLPSEDPNYWWRQDR
jgi:hypothetical protein